MVINGKELNFNIYKVSDVKKLEDGINKVKEGEEEGRALLQSGKLYEGINKMHSTYKSFFIDLVGVDVVGDCDDTLEAQKMVTDFIEGIKPKNDTSV